MATSVNLSQDEVDFSPRQGTAVCVDPERNSPEHVSDDSDTCEKILYCRSPLSGLQAPACARFVAAHVAEAAVVSD